jgi:hypothetical protein
MTGPQAHPTGCFWLRKAFGLILAIVIKTRCCRVGHKLSRGVPCNLPVPSDLNASCNVAQFSHTDSLIRVKGAAKWARMGSF